MIWIRSFIFYILLFTWTIFLTLIATPIFFSFSHKVIRYVPYIWARIVNLMLRIICNIKFNVRSDIKELEHNFIIASKHESAWETIFFLSYFPNSIYVLKKELSYIPFYGLYLASSGMIILDRKKGNTSLMKMLRVVKKRIADGFSVIIFPEGTRVKRGKRVELKSGIYAIAKTVPDTQLIPVALDSGKCWGRNSFLKYPGTINVRIHNPIKVEDLKKNEYLSLINDKINLL